MRDGEEVERIRSVNRQQKKKKKKRGDCAYIYSDTRGYIGAQIDRTRDLDN